MKKIILLNLAFLLVLALPSLKAEVGQVKDEDTTEESVSKSTSDLSVFDELDNIDLETIDQVENTQPQLKITWKMKCIGLQAKLAEYISKHKLACGTVTAGTITAIVLITYLLLKKNKTVPGTPLN